MPRRLASALALSVVLVLQLALGLLDSACTTQMAMSAPVTTTGAPSADMADCDAPVAQEHPPADHEQSRPTEGRSPAICHALSACGVSFLGSSSCDVQPTERAVVRVAVLAVAAPPSVTYPPDSPPPRA